MTLVLLKLQLLSADATFLGKESSKIMNCKIVLAIRILGLLRHLDFRTFGLQSFKLLQPMPSRSSYLQDPGTQQSKPLDLNAPVVPMSCYTFIVFDNSIFGRVIFSVCGRLFSSSSEGQFIPWSTSSSLFQWVRIGNHICNMAKPSFISPQPSHGTSFFLEG